MFCTPPKCSTSLRARVGPRPRRQGQTQPAFCGRINRASFTRLNLGLINLGLNFILVNDGGF